MKTILLIESNPDILENLTEAFEMEGYKILAANTGYMGIQMATDHIPDLVVSEILIGKINGYDVLRLLLDMPKTAGLPFIFSTTKSEKKDRALGLLMGADDYIVKPYCMEPLFSMAKKWIKSGTQRGVKSMYILPDPINTGQRVMV